MIGFIGGGNMAEALIKGMTSQGMRDILVSEPRKERRRFLEQTYRVRTTPSNREAAAECSLIILAVKPQNMSAVLDEITDVVTEDKTVVSIAAGIPLSSLEEKLRTRKLVRVMPNTPAIVQEGMSVLSLCECLPGKEIAAVREVFLSVGKVLTLPERHMNAVTAVSGSGPAFIALFVEAMRDAGVHLGLAKEHAGELAVQTLLGTARLLETGISPEKLREMVTSPGGTTAAGLQVFDGKGLKDITAEALLAALKRAEELGARK
ncbi:MAG: pyrroline-5-carboxylate reductase [Alphaproteobacteria bacterium]|uniref:Pyrroline-5-carboxylate reductase n=1 Tax=Candidatus Nitrobium versatile TaxID=2884831 RepID=A0A953JFB8_9BACT|nr:pyrroline-5-carboxylate reductase [Candidatus Nitrobium versatile]